MSENLVYTVSEFAEKLKCAPGTVRNMIKRGDLKAIQSGHTIRIPATELDRLLTDGNSSGNEQPIKEDADTDTT